VTKYLNATYLIYSSLYKKNIQFCFLYWCSQWSCEVCLGQWL